MDKTQRNYQLLVYPRGGALEPILIQPPISIEIDINRNDMSAVNVINIRIYNLNKDTRNKLRKDQFDGEDNRLVILKAGYGTNLPIIAYGNITQGWSVREGVNYITTLQCFDGGFAAKNAESKLEASKGTTKESVIRTLLKDFELAGIAVGAVGKIDGTLSRGNSYGGSTVDILHELTNGQFFIDNGKINVLADNEFIDDGSPTMVITSASGLLGTPVREGFFFRFDMLFEPRLFPGQLIILDSITGENFNGPCKVFGIQHRGMISETTAGSLTTSVGVAYGTLTGGEFEAAYQALKGQ